MTTGKKTKQLLEGKFVKSKPYVTLSTGEILKIIREKNGFTQLQLAKLTGLTQATISSLESGRISLGAERSKILAKALNVHPAVLLFPDWEGYLKAA